MLRLCFVLIVSLFFIGCASQQLPVYSKSETLLVIPKSNNNASLETWFREYYVLIEPVDQNINVKPFKVWLKNDRADYVIAKSIPSGSYRISKLKWKTNSGWRGTRAMGEGYSVDLPVTVVAGQLSILPYRFVLLQRSKGGGVVSRTGHEAISGEEFVEIGNSLGKNNNGRQWIDIAPIVEFDKGKILVFDDFKKISSIGEEMDLYVKHRKFRDSFARPKGPENEVEKNVAEFFMFVDYASTSHTTDLFVKSKKTFDLIEREDTRIGNIDFSSEIFSFNTLEQDKGSYYSLINDAKYSAPDCGLLRVLRAKNEKLEVSFIDGVSCGQHNLELSNPKYKKLHRSRMKSLKIGSAQAFRFSY